MPLSPSAPVPAISYAWIALDKDNMILEYSYNSFSTLFPSDFHSELFALYFGLCSLHPRSSVTVNTDCSYLITS